jgi:hypothetical protein
MRTRIALLFQVFVLLSTAVFAQTSPTVPAPARSQDEAVSIAYMKTVVNAQRQYKKKHGDFATSLADLVHSGSFTKRMASTDRGTYTVHFRGKKDAFSLGLVPREFAPDHRAFYVDETGKIRVEEDKPANPESPLLNDGTR